MLNYIQMKEFFLAILLLVVISCQDSDVADKISEKIVSEKSHLDTIISIDKFDVSILLGCGIGGTDSKQLDSAKNLVRNKDYKTLIRNLKSSDLLTQISSVVTLETLKEKKLVDLSIDEQNQIQQIKKSKKTCSVCQGCTGHFTGIVSDIFKPKDPNNIILAIQYKLGLVSPRQE
jgi:hypothetical protein